VNNIKHPYLTLFVSGPIILDKFDVSLKCVDGICQQCGQDHSFWPSFEDVNTSIDIIPELLAPRKEQCLECILTMKNRNRGVR
jgi:hypothetical protein